MWVKNSDQKLIAQKPIVVALIEIVMLPASSLFSFKFFATFAAVVVRPHKAYGCILQVGLARKRHQISFQLLRPFLFQREVLGFMMDLKGLSNLQTTRQYK